MRITILGCGPSGGVPSLGGNDGAGYWGKCNPHNPKNIRTRCSVLVEEGDTRILVDTSPDMRQQLLRHKISNVDAVLFTHDHADHLHGIDDLRHIVRVRQQPLDIYSDRQTLELIERRFHYLFEPTRPDILGRDPWVIPHEVADTFKVGGIEVQAYTQDHGFSTTSLGFRFGKFAYSTDAVGLDEQAFKMLEGIDTWVVDCFRYEPHTTHSWLEQALEWIDQVKPKQTYLTHMGLDLDYDELSSKLPDHVKPAYDGLVIDAFI